MHKTRRWIGATNLSGIFQAQRKEEQEVFMFIRQIVERDANKCLRLIAFLAHHR
jgi:hypothetical protein